MESKAGRDGDRLDVVILADTLCALLAQAGPDALNVRNDERLASTTPDQGIEDNSLEEGEAEGVRRKRCALPCLSGKEVERREAHKRASLVCEIRDRVSVSAITLRSSEP